MIWIRKYGIFAFLGFIITGLFAIAFLPPHHFTFELAYNLKRVLSLFLGIAYALVITLVNITPLSLLLIFVVITALLWGLWQVWRARRYPLLIFVTALIGANILFLGTGNFLDIGRLTAPISICEDYFITGKTGFQVIRYPIEARLRDDAQTFILFSTDNGTTWRQIFTAYAVNPQIAGCDNIEANFNEDTAWSVIFEQRIDNTLQNERIQYQTSDSGNTFVRVNP
ncbi:MAG: hypothetical protein MUE54_00090 [Anaerolineae bacterium]|nr:hypothetical protein [Anaerolineae bacterium]